MKTNEEKNIIDNVPQANCAQKWQTGGPLCRKIDMYMVEMTMISPLIWNRKQISKSKL